MKPRLSWPQIRVGLLNATMVNLSRLVPRSRSRWLFGHQGRLFAGNSKYLFLWVSIHRPDLKAVWLADNDETYRVINRQGFKAERRWSMQGILATVRSKAFFYCHGLSDVNARLSGGAYLVNLWHGVGLKSTMFGDKTGVMNAYRENWSTPLGRTVFYEYLTMPDIVASTSPFMQGHFGSQFCLPPERCPQLGYPRLDCAADPKVKQAALALDHDLGFHFNPDGHAETYLYMPTWRDTGRPFLAEALPDLPRLNALLQRRNALLYIKLHPWTEESWDASMFPNIRAWPPEIEVFTYFDQLTSLITDYSSVLYDYLFTRDDGAILYTFDYEAYAVEDRSLLYPFEENTAGYRAGSFEAFCRGIESGDALLPCPRAAEIRKKFWGDLVAPVSPGIVRYVEDAIGSAAWRP